MSGDYSGPARLHVRIGADGTVGAVTENITGSACLDHVALLEDLLEAVTIDSAYTEDYYRTATKTTSTTTEVTAARDELPQQP